LQDTRKANKCLNPSFWGQKQHGQTLMPLN
jgi:hypothetical protein